MVSRVPQGVAQAARDGIDEQDVLGMRLAAKGEIDRVSSEVHAERVLRMARPRLLMLIYEDKIPPQEKGET